MGVRAAGTRCKIQWRETQIYITLLTPCFGSFQVLVPLGIFLGDEITFKMRIKLQGW